MSTKFGSIYQSRAPSNTQASTGHDVTPSSSNHGPTSRPDAPMSSSRTGYLAPYDARYHVLDETTRWQKALDDHFTHIFTQSVLSQHPIDDVVVARTLHILARPTQAKIRVLALTLCTHWMRLQFRYKNARVYASEIVTLIARIADHLGRTESLKLTWRWYVAVVSCCALPVPRKNLFMRVMTVVAMTSYLFHGGQLRYGTVLNGLGYIARMAPWQDAVAVVYAFLHELGPNFALEQAGWHFVQRLLAELFPLTEGRSHVDPLCQLVSAINVLVEEWHNKAQVTLYHTRPKGNIFPMYMLT
ncbi:hypothetical protein OG21DRAFT_1601751 [Imleria badia]|nr:hypothetical protein OG21DRAFT_1601751 [Imleria badia]